jgi:hypothetical protein
VALAALAVLLARAVPAVLLTLLLAAALVLVGRQMEGPLQQMRQAQRVEQVEAPTEALAEQPLRQPETAALTREAVGSSQRVRLERAATVARETFGPKRLMVPLPAQAVALAEHLALQRLPLTAEITAVRAVGKQVVAAQEAKASSCLLIRRTAVIFSFC